MRTLTISRVVVVGAVAAVLASGSVLFQVIPVKAQDQKPSVDIVTKPKFPLDDITKPAWRCLAALC